MKKTFYNIWFVLFVLASVTINAEDAVLATFQQQSLLDASINYYDTWNYSRVTNWLPTKGDISEYIMISCRGNFNSDWKYDQVAPDRIRATKLTTGLTEWDGWTQPLLGFVDNVDEEDIQSVALPESVTANLKSGEKVLAFDVYFEDIDVQYTCDSLADYRASMKMEQGIKLQVRMQNAEAYDTITEKPAFLTKKAYITEPNTWQTIYFIEIDSADFETNEWYTNGNNINRIMLILNYQYPKAVASNYWIKDLSVIDNPDMVSSSANYDLRIKQNIKANPNPSSNYLNIETETHVQDISLYNITGKVVSQKQVTFKSSGQIDVSVLNDEIYVLKVITNTGNNYLKESPSVKLILS